MKRLRPRRPRRLLAPKQETAAPPTSSPASPPLTPNDNPTPEPVDFSALVAVATAETVVEQELAGDLPLPSGEEAGDEPFDGSDTDLIARARVDPEGFGLLYERYVDRIYSYVYHRVGNAQDAEDLTARTFHRALDALENYEDRGLPFAAWLFRIAHNLVANWHRDRSRRRLLSLDRIWSQRSEQDDPEETLQRKETHDALWQAINRLPADRRDLLLYKFSGRMSNTEIGGLLKKSESAVKSLYFRTLAALRRELEAEGWGGDPDGSVEPDADSEAGAGTEIQPGAAEVSKAPAAQDAADALLASIGERSPGASFSRESP